ncbi:MAG: outer membrane beta-barrel protein [Candidatus Aminicenantales bacterium]|jgi:hypothetical protein
MKKLVVLAAALLCAAPILSSQTIGLKLMGGGGYVLGGDLAKGVQGQSDYLKAEFGASQAYVFPKTGWTGTGEILFYLGPQFAIGLGAGYEQHLQESAVSYSVEGIDVKETIKPAFNVIPVLCTLHLYFPVGSAVKIDLFLGGGAYLTQLKWNSSYDIAVLGLNGTDVYAFDSHRTGYGAHAGLGLELALSSKLALVLDVTGRYARISGFVGDWTETGAGDFWSFSDSGTGHAVYYYDWTVAGATYPQLEFRTDKPSGPGLANVREARLDLSGLTATVGFRINLF